MKLKSVVSESDVYVGEINGKPKNEFCLREWDEKRTPKLDLPNGTKIKATRYVHRVGYEWQFSFIPASERILIASRLWAKKKVRQPMARISDGDAWHNYHRMIDDEAEQYAKFLKWTNPYGTGFHRNVHETILNEWLRYKEIEKDEWRRLWYKKLNWFTSDFEIVDRCAHWTGKRFYYDYFDKGLDPMFYQQLYLVKDKGGYFGKPIKIHPSDVVVIDE